MSEMNMVGELHSIYIQASKFHLSVGNINEELTVQTVLTTEFHLKVWNVNDEHVLGNIQQPATCIKLATKFHL